MSKKLLDVGFLVYKDWKLAVTNLSVNRQPTKIDAGDTGGNHDPMSGRNTWLFTATVLLNDANENIVIDFTPSEIVIAFNHDVYLGNGIVFSVVEQGQLDGKIVFNISGQFTSGAYYCHCEPNGLYWSDPSSGLASGWTFTNVGGYTFDQEIDTKMKLRQICELSGTSMILRYIFDWDDGDDYVFFLKYETRNIANALYRYSSSGSIGTLDNDSYPAPYTTLKTTRTAVAADTRIEFEWDYSSDPNWFRVYLCILGKIIDSIT